MRRYALLLALSAGTMLLMDPFFRVMRAESLYPDVGLVTVVYLGATGHPLAGLLASWLLGGFVDSISPGVVFGLNMELLAVTYLICLGLAEQVDILSFWTRILVVGLLYLVKAILGFLLLVVFDRDFSAYGLYLDDALWRFLPTLLLAAVFMPLMRMVDLPARRHRSRVTF